MLVYVHKVTQDIFNGVHMRLLLNIDPTHVM